MRGGSKREKETTGLIWEERDDERERKGERDDEREREGERGRERQRERERECAQVASMCTVFMQDGSPDVSAEVILQNTGYGIYSLEKLREYSGGNHDTDGLSPRVRRHGSCVGECRYTSECRK